MDIKDFNEAKKIRSDIEDIEKELEDLRVLKKKYIESDDLQTVFMVAETFYINNKQTLENKFMRL